MGKNWENQDTILSAFVNHQEGLFKIKGKKETDHNTITAIFRTSPLQQHQLKKNSIWRLKAPESNWISMNTDLITLSGSVAEILSSIDPIDVKYNKWYKKIEEVAWKNIGKTTIKTKRAEHFSELIGQLRRQKRELKTSLKKINKWTWNYCRIIKRTTD